MRLLYSTHVTANEAGLEEIRFDFVLNWFDQLLGRPHAKVFVKIWRGWVEQDTCTPPTLNEAFMISDVLMEGSTD